MWHTSRVGPCALVGSFSSSYFLCSSSLLLVLHLLLLLFLYPLLTLDGFGRPCAACVLAAVQSSKNRS